MLILYRIFLYAASPYLLGRLLVRGLREPRYFFTIRQRFGFALRPTRGANNIRPNGIWIHAVSVGEVNAGAALVFYLLKKYPKMPITVTTMTPTGADRVAELFKDEVAHFYLPYDYPGAVRRFLQTVRPRLAVVMETEIWPNLIAAAARRQVPMVYINVRLSRRAHNGYQYIKKLIAPRLKSISHFAVQAEADARRLIDLSAAPDKITITGNLKFDIEFKPSIFERAQSVRRDLGINRPIWVVGSTHSGEEEIILEAFARIKNKFENLLLVIVPRHPHRFTTVFRLCQRRYKSILRSKTNGKIHPEIDIYIADTMGELTLLLAAGDVAFIGGSLLPIGGHNVLESCAAGTPVVFGPHMFNFAEITKLVQQYKAGICIRNAAQLAEVIIKLLHDSQLRDTYINNGRKLIEKNRGALKKTCTLIDAQLT